MSINVQSPAASKVVALRPPVPALNGDRPQNAPEIFAGKELLSRADLQSLGLGYCNPHLIKLESEGRFPKRITLSPGRVAWDRDEILAFIAARKAAR